MLLRHWAKKRGTSNILKHLALVTRKNQSKSWSLGRDKRDSAAWEPQSATCHLRIYFGWQINGCCHGHLWRKQSRQLTSPTKQQSTCVLLDVELSELFLSSNWSWPTTVNKNNHKPPPLRTRRSEGLLSNPIEWLSSWIITLLFSASLLRVPPLAFSGFKNKALVNQRGKRSKSIAKISWDYYILLRWLLLQASICFFKIRYVCCDTEPAAVFAAKPAKDLRVRSR